MLVVVPDIVVGQWVAAALDRPPYEARVGRTPGEAVRTLGGWRPHLAVMDVDAGAARAMAQLADESPLDKLPVIGLTRTDEFRNRVAALDAGVDDILTKPLIAEELRAHIRALIRRTRGPYRAVSSLSVGQLEINFVERCVIAGGVRIHLTSLEQALLYLLAAGAGTVISRDAILDALWGMDFAPENNVLERHVSRLRAKLRKGLPVAHRIETIRGQGYRLIPPQQ